MRILNKGLKCGNHSFYPTQLASTPTNSKVRSLYCFLPFNWVGVGLDFNFDFEHVRGVLLVSWLNKSSQVCGLCLYTSLVFATLIDKITV